MRTSGNTAEGNSGQSRGKRFSLSIMSTRGLRGKCEALKIALSAELELWTNDGALYESKNSGGA
jgi:hypothetical protein